MRTELKEMWDECVEIIKDNISPETYKVWFACLEPRSYENKTLVLAVPSQFVCEYIEEQYIDLISKVITRVFGQGVQLQYAIKRTSQIEIDKPSLPTEHKAEGAEITTVIPDAPAVPPTDELNSQLKVSYTFANFIEGESNRLARSVGEAIAKKPAKTFNPLFVFGPSGCGKTHLVNAIGWKIKELHPNLRVLYLSAHLFEVQYTNAVRQNKVNDFIFFYQTIDVLIIDDIQELSGKTRTQNTFFHIFNHLQMNNKQIILTADRLPNLIEGLEDRLLSRFKWGLQAEIEKPTKALCRAILHHKIKQDALAIPDNVVNYIAEKVNGSVRDLEGIINSLIAFSVVFKSEVNMKLADKVLPNYLHVDDTPTSIEDIKKFVCKHYNISETELCSQSRRQPINQIRQTVAYLASHLTEMTNTQIGESLGGRTHATILHSINHIKELTEVDDKFCKEIEELEEELKRR